LRGTTSAVERGGKPETSCVYVIPIGSGLTINFGKWAISLGIEGNVTQYQMNYSRSYWFTFLPFYHMGARMNY